MATIGVHAHHHVSLAGTDALFETIAEEAFRHYARVWKPGTLAVNRSSLVSGSPREIQFFGLYFEREYGISLLV